MLKMLRYYLKWTWQKQTQREGLNPGGKGEQETWSCMRMRKIHAFLPRQTGVYTDPQQRVFSPEKECRINILQLAGLIFHALRVCIGRATWILLSEAFCLRDTSKNGRRGRRTVTGMIALLGVMDTHRANTHSASSGGGGMGADG